MLKKDRIHLAIFSDQIAWATEYVLNDKARVLAYPNLEDRDADEDTMVSRHIVRVCAKVAVWNYFYRQGLRFYHDFTGLRLWPEVGPFDVKCRRGPDQDGFVQLSDVRSPEGDRSDRIVMFTTVDPAMCRDRHHLDAPGGVLTGVPTVGEDGNFRGFSITGWLRYKDCESKWIRSTSREGLYVIPPSEMNPVPHLEIDNEIEKWPVDAEKRRRIEQFGTSEYVVAIRSRTFAAQSD